MRFWDRIKSLWRRLWRRNRIKGIVVVESMSDVPQSTGGRLYLVGSEKLKWLVLSCPCRCGDRIDANLMTTRNPHWNVTLRDNRISVHPSLWQPREKCGSHFWVRDGEIRWVG